MTKREIVTWLKKEQEKAVQRVKDQTALNLEAAEERLWLEVNLEEDAAGLQKMIDEFKAAVMKFEAKMDALDGITTSPYSRISSHLYNITKSNTAVQENLKYMVQKDHSSRFQRIKRNGAELEAKVNSTYITVIENVKTMKDGKTALEYIARLGFDMGDLEKSAAKAAECTAIMQPIDCRYLLLGRKEG